MEKEFRHSYADSLHLERRYANNGGVDSLRNPRSVLINSELGKTYY